MASTLHVSEGQIIDDEGNRIATLSELAEAERFTALEERITKLENAAVVEPPPEAGAGPEVPMTTMSGSPDDEPSPPGGPLKIHVGDEVAAPENP